jgi:hypothetical protein
MHKLLKDIGKALLWTLVIVLIVLCSTGTVQQFIYRNF